MSLSATPVLAASNKHKKYQPKPPVTTPVPIPTPVPTPIPVPTPPASTCTTGWYVTGYFTPVESDYIGATQTVTVGGAAYTFNSAFLTAVKMEGWGKTNLGKYIGFYDNTWHFSNAPLDAKDAPLATNTVAVDASLIALGSSLTIPTLTTLGTKTFIATDIGNGVVGKHIDVYTGEGSVAEQMTFKITGNNNTVCVVT